MKKNIFKIVTLASILSIGTLSSCTSDFLNVDSQENIAIDDQASQSPEKYVNGIRNEYHLLFYSKNNI